MVVDLITAFCSHDLEIAWRLWHRAAVGWKRDDELHRKFTRCYFKLIIMKLNFRKHFAAGKSFLISLNVSSWRVPLGLDLYTVFN